MLLYHLFADHSRSFADLWVWKMFLLGLGLVLTWESFKIDAFAQIIWQEINLMSR